MHKSFLHHLRYLTLRYLTYINLDRSHSMAYYTILYYTKYTIPIILEYLLIKIETEIEIEMEMDICHTLCIY